jgi:hypothetical protein
MLESSLSLANKQKLKPCDDFYEFVCAGKNKFYKEEKKADGGNQKDLVNFYTEKVMGEFGWNSPTICVFLENTKYNRTIHLHLQSFAINYIPIKKFDFYLL